MNQNKPVVTLLLLDKIDFKPKNFIEDKDDNVDNKETIPYYLNSRLLISI